MFSADTFRVPPPIDKYAYAIHKVTRHMTSMPLHNDYETDCVVGVFTDFTSLSDFMMKQFGIPLFDFNLCDRHSDLYKRFKIYIERVPLFSEEIPFDVMSQYVL